jgi:RNA recognition motif-containing protein
MNIYVGNLSHNTTEENLQQAFESFGQVISARIIKDKCKYGSGHPHRLLRRTR